MKFAKPKLYDEDGKEIIPPEGANGFIVGKNGRFVWTTAEHDKLTIIYTPNLNDKPIAENVNVNFKFAEVPRIFEEAWYVKRPRKKVRMKTRVSRVKRKG